MKAKSIIFVVLFLLSGIFYYNLTDGGEETSSHKIVNVIDGDTVETFGGDRIRLKGLNTPEKSMDWNLEATEFLKNRVLNEEVEIKSYGRDKYNRVLGYLILDGENINAEILGNGLGSLYYYGKDEFYEEMAEEEEFARLNKLGIWKESPNFGCLEIVEFRFGEPEFLKLKNNCDGDLDILLKDDATHIYREEIRKGGVFEKSFSHIWNDAGDTIYIWDDKGLLIFYRYH